MKFKDPEGWMTEGELAWLYEQAKTMRTIVEIGSHKGAGSSTALASGVRDGGGTLTCVDRFMDVGWRACFKANILDKFKGVDLLALPSIDAATLFLPRSIDMVFIDADHTYESVKADIAAWKPMCSRLICGHDYTHPGVKRAVDEAFPQVDRLDHSIWAVHFGGQIS